MIRLRRSRYTSIQISVSIDNYGALQCNLVRVCMSLAYRVSTNGRIKIRTWKEKRE